MRRPASQRDTVTIPHTEYQELTEIAALWKDMDLRLKNVERAIKNPSYQEEEIRPAKSKKLAPPMVRELL